MTGPAARITRGRSRRAADGRSLPTGSRTARRDRPAARRRLRGGAAVGVGRGPPTRRPGRCCWPRCPATARRTRRRLPARRRRREAGRAARPAAAAVGAAGVPLLHDALRTNDTRLVAAALGPVRAATSTTHAWRHGVLKCLFIGVPLAAVAGLAAPRRRRAGPHARRLRRRAHAAGRAVPADAARDPRPRRPPSHAEQEES